MKAARILLASLTVLLAACGQGADTAAPEAHKPLYEDYTDTQITLVKINGVDMQLRKPTVVEGVTYGEIRATGLMDESTAVGASDGAEFVPAGGLIQMVDHSTSSKDRTYRDDALYLNARGAAGYEKARYHRSYRIVLGVITQLAQERARAINNCKLARAWSEALIRHNHIDLANRVTAACNAVSDWTDIRIGLVSQARYPNSIGILN